MIREIPASPLLCWMSMQLEGWEVPEFRCSGHGARRTSHCWSGLTWRLDISVFTWEGASSALTHSSSIQRQVGAVVLLLNRGITGSSKFDQIKSSHVTAFLPDYFQHSGFVPAHVLKPGTCVTWAWYNQTKPWCEPYNSIRPGLYQVSTLLCAAAALLSPKDGFTALANPSQREILPPFKLRSLF